MKGILAWMKSHVPVVVLCAVVLISLPSAFAVSAMLNRNLRTAREKEVNADLTALNANTTYVIPPVTVGGAAVEQPWGAPNETLTKWFLEQRAARDAQVNEVVKLASEMNQEGHEVLLTGLFPAPAQADSVEERLAFVDLITGKGETPSVYQRLFDDIHAGSPADPVALQEELKELEQREEDRHRAEFGDAEKTPEQRKTILDKLIGQRLGRYQRRAQEISVYATMDCLPPHGTELPRKSFNEPQDIWQCFEWQWDYWVVADILKAVGAANADDSGRWMPVDQAVVKRIEKIRVDRLPIQGDTAVTEDTWAPTGAEKAPLDPYYSITGRRTSKFNSQYDVRLVNLDVVVDSSRVADLVNAISRTNFMTVIGCELREMDPWKDLKEGYYYGTGHVMKAKLQIETVWLRSWTEPLMPEDLKGYLGIGTAAAEAPATPPEPAPAPVRRGTPKGMEEDAGAVRGRRGRDDGGG